MESEEYKDSSDKDGVELLRIFPTEIWHRILEEFADAQTVACATHASLYFRNIALPLRTTFLFPQVFFLLSQYIHLEKAKEYKKFPIKQFSKKTYNRIKSWYFNILRCRQVCHTWKVGVDSAYHRFGDNTSSCRSYKKCTQDLKSAYSQTMSWPYETFRLIWFHDYDPTRLQRFVKHFESLRNHTNAKQMCAIFSRCITVKVGYRDEDELSRVQTQLLPLMRQLLNICGAGIWNLYLTLDKFSVANYQILQEILSGLPNLKRLHVTCETLDPLSQTRHIIDHVIESEPPPHLPSLKKLTLAKCFPSTFINALVQQNLHVVKLEFSNIDFPNDCVDFIEAPLQNLDSICVELKKPNPFYKVKQIFNTWPVLTSLSVEFHCESADWNEIFKTIADKCGQTLTFLGLSLPSRENPSHNLKPLYLPRLQELVLCLHEYAPLDFLLPLGPVLKMLCLKNKWDDGDNQVSLAKEKDTEIKLLEYMNKPLESNIWIKMPNLQELQYGGPFNPVTKECGWIILKKKTAHGTKFKVETKHNLD